MAPETDYTATRPLTCGIEEFARIVGIGEAAARALTAGELHRPPGFYVGKQYRIIREEIPRWLLSVNGAQLASS